MVRPGLASHLHHAFLALCLLLVSQVSHAATGAIRLTWDANTESDLAHYVLVWGTSPGVYTQSLSVDATTPTAEVTGLPDGTYYFAVQAVSTAGPVSDYSNEVVATVADTAVISPLTLAGITPASGPVAGGTDVVIQGTGFAPGMTVTIGGAAATVLQETETTLTVRTPPGTAGTAAVAVITPDGAAATLASGFTYQVVLVPPTITDVTPATGSGSGGTAVTITGGNFQPGVSVLFGGVAAAVASQSETVLVVQAPAGAGAVPISVTNPDGTSAQATQAFTYQPVLVPPTVAEVTPLSGPESGGTTVTITGADFQPGATVRFGASLALPVSQSATVLVVSTPAGSGLVPITVTNPDATAAQAAQSFSYQAPPTPPVITDVAPLSGASGGGTAVTIAGNNFQPGAVVRFGSAAATVMSQSPTALVVQSPAGSGVTPISVTNPDTLSAQAGQAFTYVLVPSISRLSPLTGPTSGGTDVTIAGSDFQAGATVKFGSVGATVLATSTSSIVVRSPAQGAGLVAITVQNPNGHTAAATESFAYVAPAPSITGLSKLSGPVGGGTELTLSGSNLQAGAVVAFGTVPATVVSSSSFAIVVRTPAHEAGQVSVTVSNPDGQSAAAVQSFTYLAPPAITALSATSGPATGGTNVTISGSGFQNGAVVRFGALQATVSAVTTTSLVARAPAQTAGTVTVTLQNPDGQSTQASQTFTYQGPPMVTSLSVLSGTTDGGTDVTITGSGFQANATVRFGALAATITSVSATSIVARTPAQSAGTATVTVTNPDGQSGQAPQFFTYVTVAWPTVTSFSPTSGATGGGTEVTITGSSFRAGVVVRFGGVPATVSVWTPTRLVVKTPPHAKGTVALTVVNADGYGVTVPDAYTYRGKPPAVTTVAPQSGSVSGGTEVVLDGSNFDASVSVSVDAVQATVVSVTPTRLVIRMPAHAPAKVGLTLTNGDSQVTWMPGAFTYVAGAAAITSVLPASGPAAGGTAVTIIGTGFASGATVTFDGRPVPVVSQDGDVLTVSAPAHAAGPVDVQVVTAGQTATASGAFIYEAADAVFTRYFAEGAAGAFFSTRFALANPHDEPVPVTVMFTDTRGVATPMQITVPAFSRATIDERNRPAMGSDAFATRFEAPRAIGIERTMTWAAGGLAYGSHSETGVAAPRTSWLLAEGATIAGFSTYYLLQNPTDMLAQIKVQYLLASGERIEKRYDVAPRSRANILVNKEHPSLAAAEMSATITSLNDVPVVVERSMYRDSGDQLFTTGHNSAAIEAPALRWFLAEGATGGTFDEFVLIANPNATPATLRVSYLRAGAAPIVKTYTAKASSRLTIWVDQEAPELAAAEVSIIVEAVTPTPVVVERSMWWSATPGGAWTEAHNNRGTTTTAARWIVADGEAGGAGEASTYVLVANTAGVDAAVRFTLLTETGQTRTAEAVVSAQGRYTIDVAGTFPEARDSRFSVLVESVTGDAPLVVERASYSSTAAVTWAAGSNALALPLP